MHYSTLANRFANTVTYFEQLWEWSNVTDFFPPCLMYYLNLWIHIVIQVNIHTQTHWVVCFWGQSFVWLTHINQIIYSLCTQVSVSFIVDVSQLWPFEGNPLSGGVQYINLPAVSYVLKPTPTLGLTLLKTSVWQRMKKQSSKTEPLTNSQKNNGLDMICLHVPKCKKKHFGLNTRDSYYSILMMD